MVRRYAHYPRGAARKSPTRESYRPWLDRLRRALVIVATLAGLTAVTAAGALFYRWVDAPVRSVVITSPLQRLGRDEVESMITAAIDGGFLSLDLDGLCAALEIHPWIDRATVRRYWPGRIEVAIVEEVAIARWGADDYVNQHGRILPRDKVSGLEDLPLLSGPEARVEDVMREYRDISELLSTQGLRVSEFGVDEYQRWRLRLRGGIAVTLGRERVLARMRRFMRVWEAELQARRDDIQAVDARYENGVAVLWR